MLYPLTFEPIFKERVWGGRNLQRLFHKSLPGDAPIGESWEISDHGEDVSIVANGALKGKSLRWLMENHAADLLGDASSQNGRFPLLIKILDAQEKLSLQVHPPAGVAAKLKGEPKTEMWYIADATPEAELFVGLKRGVTRADFERKVRDGSVADCFHRINVRPGDAMFLPSGRVHAIGGGNVIFEIQQNSDTTYRVFDWNRVGLDGKPRDLHIEQSLASIDFNDFEPPLLPAGWEGKPGRQRRRLVHDPLFTVESWRLSPGAGPDVVPRRMQIFGTLSGTLKVSGAGEIIRLTPGQFCLIPASASAISIMAADVTTCLVTRVGGE